MPRSLIAAAVLIVLATLAGCTPAPETPVIPTADPSVNQTAEPGSTPVQEQPPTPEPPTPTFTPEPPFVGIGPWPVSFHTADGVTLHGTLYGEGETGVILAPMYIGGQRGWASFAEVLAAQGYRVLAYDNRGSGLSEGERNPSTAADDLAAAVLFMREHQFTPAVLIGAGIGGSAAVKTAAQDTTFAGIAVLSAPRSFEGLEVSDADLGALTAPSLWIGTRNDMTQNVETMHELAGGTDKTLWIYEGSSLQGTFIFEGADANDLRQRLIDFVVRVTGA